MSERADIAALRALLERATRGPWSACPMNEYVFADDGHMVSDQGDLDEDAPAGLVQRIRGYGAEKAGHRPEGSQDANITLIVAAVNALPQLLKEMEEARATIATAPDVLGVPLGVIAQLRAENAALRDKLAYVQNERLDAGSTNTEMAMLAGDRRGLLKAIVEAMPMEQRNEWRAHLRQALRAVDCRHVAEAQAGLRLIAAIDDASEHLATKEPAR